MAVAMTAFWQWRGGDKQASQASAGQQGVCMSASSQTQQQRADQPSSLASCDTEQGASVMDLRWGWTPDRLTSCTK